MKQQVYNPYLPLDEFVCDGEPHVFGDKLYIFGSHDKEGGDTFCELDYVVYSSPTDDLKNWRCEETIYSAKQDPRADENRKYLYAPDVTRGPDGRYYLYYVLSGYRGKGGFDGPISVAVCDNPAGKYEYYGDVHTKDGKPLRFIPFDPAILNDDGRIWLYYGWALAQAIHVTPEMKSKLYQVMQSMFNKTEEDILSEPLNLMGANVAELSVDMLTVISEPKRIVPAEMDAFETSFARHAFFEASSIRKIGDIYYFIYSSSLNHELCYATSPYPDRDFIYRGTIVSNGNIGYAGRAENERVNMTGNNHGGIELVNDKAYVFYHRHTHKTTYSRQGCAEEIEIAPDGTIRQVEVTSGGLNGSPLDAMGTYPAPIACWITNGKMPHNPNGVCEEDIPFVTHDFQDRYISGVTNGTLIGFKYFDFRGKTIVSVLTRGTGIGIMRIINEQNCNKGEISIVPSNKWNKSSIKIEMLGKQALFFVFNGTGRCDFLSFELSR
jgi:hypothetical protein